MSATHFYNYFIKIIKKCLTLILMRVEYVARLEGWIIKNLKTNCVGALKLFECYRYKS